MPGDDDPEQGIPEAEYRPAVMLSDEDRAKIDSFRSKHSTELLVILFTDLVGSAALKSELGDQAYKKLDDQHRRLLLHALQKSKKAQAIRVEGDSYIFVFLKPSDAIKFALDTQASHRAARAGDWPRLPEFRVGIHLGTVVVEEGILGPQAPGEIGDIKGLQADMTARVMGLADGGQILCSRAVFDDARQALKGADLEGIGTLGWQSHGPYILKGRDDPLEICEVGEEGIALFEKPPGNDKARPVDLADEELGWRPALGVVVPGTDWELDEKLGEGEFGEVWLGRNRSSGERQVYKFCFKRERVAWLKREARLLTELKRRLPGHPNIVAFRDVMTKDDKPPYYITMEYVEGPSLEEWLATAPETKERLEIIAQVADGLDAVHAEGIYHRDVKPSNVLLARRSDGSLQAKLSDFGLGTAEDRDLLRSVYASRVDGLAGTWDYIAPEVRDGKPASAQSDIYALGLTLYQVLAGDLHRPLVSGWQREIKSEILVEDIARCTDTDAAERYPRAKELAGALRGHDQRLRARQLEREREQHRKHAIRFRIVSAVVGAFAFVMLGFGGYAWHQRNIAKAERESAIIAKDETELQRDMAKRQRDRAIKQKELALNAIKKMTRDVPDRLEDVPGTLAILREILEDNVKMLDEVLALEPDTPDALREKCVVLTLIGDRWLLLGATHKALEAYESGFQIAKALAASDTGCVEAQCDLATGYEKLGEAYLPLGRAAEALEAYSAGLEVRKTLAASQPDDPDRQRDVALSYKKLGDAYFNLGRYRESAEALQPALDILDALAASHPEDTELQHELAESHNILGDIHFRVGRTREALDEYEKGMAMMVASDPQGDERQKVLRDGFGRVGDTYHRIGNDDEALQCYEDALSAAQALVDLNPESAVAKRKLAAIYNKLGDFHRDEGLLPQATKAYKTMLAINKELAAVDPESFVTQRALAVSHNRLSDMHFRENRTDQALEASQKAMAIIEALATDRESVAAQRDLAIGHGCLGDIHYQSGNYEDALAKYRIMLTILEEIAASNPEDAGAVSYTHLTLPTN